MRKWKPHFVPSDRGVPDEAFTTAVGRLMLTAGRCETSLSLQVLRLLEHPNAGKALPLLGGMEVNVKLSIIRIMAAAKLKTNEAKQIGNACDAVRSSYGDRNFIAHGYSLAGEESGSAVVQSMRYEADGFLPEVKTMTIEQLNSQANRLLHAVQDIARLLTDFGVQELQPPLQPADEKSKPRSLRPER